MSCNKTQRFMSDYFDDQLSHNDRQLLQSHLAACPQCTDELQGLIQADNLLNDWRVERVPVWDRGMSYFETRKKMSLNFSFGFWQQWGPVMASVVLLIAVAFNVQISKTSGGFTIAFGGQSAGLNEEYLQQQLQAFEERQDVKDLRLMQAVLEQTQVNTSQTVEQIYTLFDEQRRSDLQLMELSYQQLADSDYQMGQSMQQLVSFMVPR